MICIECGGYRTGPLPTCATCDFRALMRERDRLERRAQEAEARARKAEAVMETALRHLDIATCVDTEQGEAFRQAAYAQTEIGRYLDFRPRGKE